MNISNILVNLARKHALRSVNYDRPTEHGLDYPPTTMNISGRLVELARKLEENKKIFCNIIIIIFV